MVDLDNDGLPDLFLVTGSVYPEVERTLPAYPFRTPRLVFRNLGDGRFEELIEEAGRGVAAAHTSRGCAFGDFDNDGDVDILVMNMNEPPSLLRNDVSGGGHWLKVLLVGVTSNRSAIGARVTARYGDRTQAQEVQRAIELLLGQRPPPALRPGRRHGRRPDDPLAERGTRRRSPTSRPTSSSSFAKAPASSAGRSSAADKVAGQTSQTHQASIAPTLDRADRPPPGEVGRAIQDITGRLAPTVDPASRWSCSSRPRLRARARRRRKSSALVLTTA